MEAVRRHRLRSVLLDLSDRVTQGECFEPAYVWERLNKEVNLQVEADVWEPETKRLVNILTHFVTDADIRERDQNYNALQRQELLAAISALRRLTEI